MNRSIFKSVRWKLITCSALSFLFSIITEFVLGMIIFVISSKMGRSPRGFGIVLKGDDITVSGRAADLRNLRYFDDRLQFAFGISRNMLVTMLVTMAAAGFFFFVIYFMLLTRRLTLDLSYIAGDIKKISRGDEDVELKFDRDDEISDIADSVNEMKKKIHRLMKAERDALDANRELITCVAHDLRTPITSVTGYVELAVSDKYTPDQKKKFADIAVSKSRRLEKLIEDLFNYTKFMSGEVTLKKEKIDLVRLLDQMAEEFYPIFEDNSLEFEYTKDADRCPVTVDPSLIARAVGNLISNAVKYGRDGKRIILREKEDGKGIKISVTNFGLVIPEESLSRVFDKFYRVEDSRSRNTGGTGLGLNIAKEVVELHGGKISVRSDITGTTFTIWLPDSVRTPAEKQA